MFPAEDSQSVPAEASGLPEAAAGQSPLPCDRLVQAGIDVPLGLDYCGGDEDFFREMLQMFCDQSVQKREEIVSLYESANWKDYAVKVHALKSTALTIGAQELSAQAKELELAGKRGDVDFIRAHHTELLQAHEELCAQIAGI